MLKTGGSREIIGLRRGNDAFGYRLQLREAARHVSFEDAHSTQATYFSAGPVFC